MDRLLAIAEAAVAGADAQLGAYAFVGSQDVRTKWLAASALASGGGGGGNTRVTTDGDTRVTTGAETRITA